ncbi:MAG: ABC transporter permease [Lewinellaceae bacterium]|nr:ABC transporter permease [Lewinellaceae bacterium]
MLRYLIKRLLFFIPALFMVSLVAFALSKLAPGDPVLIMSRSRADETMRNLVDAERVYREYSRLLGLDKPVFYFAFSNQAFPDSLYRIINPERQQTLRKLLYQFGNWPALESYYQAIRPVETELRQLLATKATDEVIEHLRITQGIYTTFDTAGIRNRLVALNTFGNTIPENKTLHTAVDNLQEAYRQLCQHPQRSRLFLPAIHWYGFDNQYHRWLSSCLQGNFGVSYLDGRPVSRKIREALRWTLRLNLTAIFLAYLLAIPLGVQMARRAHSSFDRSMTLILFLLYSLPSFWVATTLLIFFTTPEYGMQFFTITGISDIPAGASWGQRISENIRHMVLPVFCLTYGSLAFISRQMRNALLEVLQQDFIRTARAKGLPERVVIWKHGFRNALFPIITLFGSIFPAVIAGSVIIEVIFNVPGMGKLTVDSIRSQDWPMVYTILLLSALLTMVGLLVSDMLYAIADPRVNYQEKTT